MTRIEKAQEARREQLRHSATVAWHYTPDGIALTFREGLSDPHTRVYKTTRGAKIAERKFFNRIHREGMKK